MTEVKNIDDLISASLVGTPAPEPTRVESEAPADEPETLSTSEPEKVDNKVDNNETESDQDAQDLPGKSEKSEKLEESTKDAYGNDIAPPRTYTEEEVQRMIRERLSRGRHAEQQTPQQQIQQAQQVSQDFSHDPESELSWEQQLDAHIDRRIETRQAKAQELAWKAEQDQIQAQFEDKFTNGMNRYPDFRESVGKMPIDNQMMMATRGMDDPAGFLYAASKTQPKELERIAQIRDPYTKALEIGKLDEKMRKVRNNVSRAPKPVEAVKGDMPDKGIEKRSIDSLIASHAKQKQNERRR